MIIRDYNGNKLYKGQSNYLIVAHRGYHSSIIPQNTLEACIAAADADFDGVEIDIRKTLDNVYVLSHNATVTLYNNGQSTTVQIDNSNYSTIQNYTWDSAGKYKISTLMSTFNTLKRYGLWIICDIKSGSKIDVAHLAAISGKIERTIIQISLVDAFTYKDELKRFPNLKLSMYPSIYWRLEQLVNELPNQIFAGMNVQGTDDTAIPNALACGVPLWFSGCTLNNKEKWQVIGLGCMANLDDTITKEEFEEALNIDYTIPTSITSSANSITVTANGSVTITANSSVNTPCGYIYGYTKNPSVASVIQREFGASVQFDVTGVSAGTTELILFSGNGIVKSIPITVSE